MQDNDKKREEIIRLCKLLRETDKEFEKAKVKRLAITIIGFAAFYFWCISALEGMPTGVNVLFAIVGAIFVAGLHVWINSFVFAYLFRKGREETEALESIKKRIRELK